MPVLHVLTKQGLTCLPLEKYGNRSIAQHVGYQAVPSSWRLNGRDQTAIPPSGPAALFTPHQVFARSHLCTRIYLNFSSVLHTFFFQAEGFRLFFKVKKSSTTYLTLTSSTVMHTPMDKAASTCLCSPQHSRHELSPKCHDELLCSIVSVQYLLPTQLFIPFSTHLSHLSRTASWK